VSEQSFDLPGRVDAIVRESARKAEVAGAARVLLEEIIRPLRESWWRAFPKVPARLEDLMQARADACAILSVEKVLRDLAAEVPPGGLDSRSMLEAALEQAEEELGEIQGPETNIE